MNIIIHQITQISVSFYIVLVRRIQNLVFSTQGIDSYVNSMHFHVEFDIELQNSVHSNIEVYVKIYKLLYMSASPEVVAAALAAASELGGFLGAERPPRERFGGSGAQPPIRDLDVCVSYSLGFSVVYDDIVEMLQSFL